MSINYREHGDRLGEAKVEKPTRRPSRSSILLVAAVIGLAVAARARRSGAPRTVQREAADRASRKPGLDIGKINDPNTRDPVGPHVEGEAVVRAEILLDRLKFSPGEINDSYNDNLAKATAAFQAASGLPALGSMDAPTWSALNDDQAAGHVKNDTGPPPQPPPPAANPGGNPSYNQNQNQANGQGGLPTPGGTGNSPPGRPQNGNAPSPPPPSPSPPPAVISYTIAPQDVAGPFTRLPKVRGSNRGERMMLAEAKLHELNYASPLELLAAKFHASPRLLAQLNPGIGFDKVGEQVQVPNVLTPAPPPAASVVVDASTHSVTALDSSGKVLAFYPATVGSKHDPVPVGNWKVVEVRWNPKFKYNPNLFWDSKNKRPRATIAPGPRNPVGVVWIGLSKEHYGIHGTPDPSRIGETYSHGCIRLTNWDAAELARMVSRGTPAVLEEGTPLHTSPASSFH